MQHYLTLITSNVGEKLAAWRSYWMTHEVDQLLTNAGRAKRMLLRQMESRVFVTQTAVTYYGHYRLRFFVHGATARRDDVLEALVGAIRAVFGREKETFVVTLEGADPARPSYYCHPSALTRASLIGKPVPELPHIGLAHDTILFAPNANYYGDLVVCEHYLTRKRRQ